ncbi:recombinase RecT [Patescibacteria group bacterium]|nr:recombinase RecT [Patescibacteria group bacterium]
MADEIQETKKTLTISRMVHDQGFIKQAQDTLGEGTQQFLSSVLSLYNSESKLQNLDPVELYNCCLMAAAIKLPFNSNLGQAYIIPYKGHPQLQIGWKGFIQLAQRSGQFKTIGANPVYENEINGIDPMTGEINFDFKLKKDGKVVGYMAYFRLLNGFEKNLYMTVEELQRHGKRYSQTFKSGIGVWVDNFEAMAQKTVIKLLLNKYAPLSIDMAKAIEIDQADQDGDYTDNKPRVEIVEATLGESEEDRKNHESK